MMQRCSSSRSSSHRSSCPCGLFHPPGSSLCHFYGAGGEVGDGPYGVDCTLSLGTPSTRGSTANDRSSSRSGGRLSNLCWDLFHPKPQPPVDSSRDHRPAAGSDVAPVHHLGGEALLARRCANCDTTSTPLWRNGPRGPKSLCNACGIRYKKEERRANSNTTAEVGQQYPPPQAAYPWPYAAAAPATAHRTPAEFRLIHGDDEGAGPFLSWRINTCSNMYSS